MTRLPSAVPLPESIQLEWMTRLIGVTTPAEIARMVVALVRSHFGCDAVLVTWSGDSAETFGDSATGEGHDDHLQRAAALLAGAEHFSIDGQQVAVRLQPERAALLMQCRHGQSPQELVESIGPCLQVAGMHLQRALKLADLHHSHKQLERSETLQRALFAISDLAGSDRDMPEMLRGIHAMVSTLMYAENFFIVRHDAERDSLRFLYFADVEDAEAPDTAQDFPMRRWEHTLTWYLIRGGKALMGSAEQLQQQVSGPLVMNGPDSIDWLGVPMLRDAKVHGALVVQSYQEGVGFSDEDRILLEFVGNHILTALERKQSKDELEQKVRSRTLELAEANLGLQQEVFERQRAERLQAALFHLAQLATADIDETEFYQRVHAVVGELLNADNLFIALFSDDRRVLEFPYYVDAGTPRIASRELKRGLSEYVLRHGEPLLGGRAQIDELVRRGEIERIGNPAVCWLGVPLRVRDEVIGLVGVQSYTDAVIYVPADQELLSFAALQIANSIHRRRSAVLLQSAYAELEQRVEERTRELREQILQREHMQDQLKQQVMHDALTGLPNRDYLRDRLERVLASMQREPDRRCALLYLDIDRFKVINDSLGHLAGDQMLKEVGRRLLNCVRDPDMVARLSGDEFAILLEDVKTPQTAQAVAQRVLETLGLPLQLAGRELQPSVSIGIAIGDASYTMADEVVRDADLALYRAKELGRRRFELFDETLARNAVDVLTMEGELRHALQHDEFEPHLQPVCRIDNGDIVGYEMLLRWNHPLHGVIGPASFLKVAQDSGHIEAIDWRLFELGCRAMSQLTDRGAFVTINISAEHLRHADFDQRLLRLLADTGLSPVRLIVEVTEGALLDDPERVRAMLDRLRTHGVGAALDDFGTGYSSLSYLHSLPLRMLKIDRAFVHALDDGMHTTTTTVVAAILALARALNIQVVAEGIETPAQRAALWGMGCEFGQGYLLGRPAPIGQWKSAMRAHPATAAT
ncbi:MAG: EAL domain-containing protein [Lysobacterales bacterium]